MDLPDIPYEDEVIELRSLSSSSNQENKHLLVLMANIEEVSKTTLTLAEDEGSNTTLTVHEHSHENDHLESCHSNSEDLSLETL